MALIIYLVSSLLHGSEKRSPSSGWFGLGDLIQRACPQVPSHITHHPAHLSCHQGLAMHQRCECSVGSCTQVSPGALFNTPYLSIIFLKPLVPSLSAGLLMLEVKHPIYLPAVGWVSTQAAGARGEIPTSAPSASANPCLSLNPQLWPNSEAEPGVAAKNEVCPLPVEGARRCRRSPPRATSSDTELRSLLCWSSAC